MYKLIFLGIVGISLAIDFENEEYIKTRKSFWQISLISSASEVIFIIKNLRSYTQRSDQD